MDLIENEMMKVELIVNDLGPAGLAGSGAYLACFQWVGVFVSSFIWYIPIEKWACNGTYALSTADADESTINLGGSIPFPFTLTIVIA